MPLKVLVVDDSQFFQQRLKEMLNEHAQLNVVGLAANGREAIDMAARLKPDVITMDYEMPVLDGVSAVRAIMADRPVPILMFSSLTYEGARTTLDALDAGAVDFLPKNFSEISSSSSNLKRKLHDRLLAIARQPSRTPPPATAAPQPTATPRSTTPGSTAPSPGVTPRDTSPQRPAAANRDVSLKGKKKLLVIGASTGGPVALVDVLTKLPKNFPLPIVLIQHMPENFTKAFAERLDRQCLISVKEAVDGDRLMPGKALLAPGGKQLLVDSRGTGVKILPGDDRVNYKPCVDVTFGSAANVFGNKTIGVILTGMGSDGCEGARLIKHKGGTIWSQDQNTSVIYGMPMAVARAGLSDRVLPLDEVGAALVKAL